MANQEQLRRLKQGVEGWNKWREENPDIGIDLIKASLMDADLEMANLGRAYLREADFRGANLCRADLRNTDFREADLRGASFNEACLNGTNLGRANLRLAVLSSADLSFANLNGADLNGADLYGTVLSGAKLVGADLSGTDLKEAILKRAYFSSTILGNVDLRETKGLEDVIHLGPSLISTSTLKRSKGIISVKFLRGCGLSDWEIESAKLYQPGLSAKEVNDIVYRVYDQRANQAIQINNLFISYSHIDGGFVDEIEEHLVENGVRFWRDIHDATAGRLEKIVDQAMRLNPTVLLILSEHSVRSDWVEHEARSARKLEKELGRDVLCPIALDDAWKNCRWPARLREQIMEYNILDFSKWQDDREFGKMFRKLIDGLDLFYKEG